MANLNILWDALGFNKNRSGNLIVVRRMQACHAPPNVVEMQHYYHQMASLYQERVNLLENVLSNSCVHAWIKYEIVTNLPCLVYLEEPYFYV